MGNSHISWFKKKMRARCWWLIPVILATQKAEGDCGLKPARANSLGDPISKKNPSQK
jgi:hypothetical protein